MCLRKKCALIRKVHLTTQVYGNLFIVLRYTTLAGLRMHEQTFELISTTCIHTNVLTKIRIMHLCDGGGLAQACPKCINFPLIL